AGVSGDGSVPLWAMMTGGSSTLLTTRTPMAPAFCAWRTLTVNSHVPRSTRAILPATSVSMGTQASLSGPASATSPEVGGSSGPNSEPAASYSPAMDSGESMVIAITSAPPSSDAATEMTPSATAGEPVTYGMGPALPAAATTMTPLSAAFWAAIDEGSSGWP